MKQASTDQRGIAHLGLILIVVAVLGVIGFAGYTVLNKGGEKVAQTVADKAADKAMQQAAKEECKRINDDDLCKFYTQFKLTKQYRMTMTAPDGSKSVFEMDGDKSHTSMHGGGMHFESISIGDDYYYKSGDTWYKQAAKEQTNLPKTSDLELKEPAADTDTSKASEDQPVYRKLGKEACGPLQCFKYEIVESADGSDKQFIWFDDKDYQMRRASTVAAEGTTDTTFEYATVSVKAPAQFKTLEQNQYIDPTSGEVMTMPDYSGM